MTGSRLTWPFTGRDHELATLVDALPHTGVVVIAGPAGVGKTRLAREVAARVGAGGPSPRWVVGTASARDVPLGPFVPWLTARRSDGADRPAVAGLQHAIDALGGAGPRAVLGIDDAHLLDGASATVLQQLAIRRALRLVITVRSGEPTPEAVSALWKDGWGPRWDLDPLDEAATGALVEAALGGPVAAATRRRLHLSTCGNALWLRHLVEGERDAGHLVPAEGIWVWTGRPAITPALEELVGAHLGDLSPALHRVLELVTFGEPLGLGLVAGLGDPEAVEEAADRGLIVVRTDGSRAEIRLAHPLYGEVVRARTDPGRARRVRGEIAGALGTTGARRAGDDLRRAVLGLDSDRPAGSDLMIAAAAQANALGDLALAERLFRAARDAGGGFDAQLGLAHTVGWLMRPEDADGELRAAVRVADTDARRTRATLALVNNLYVLLGRVDEAREVLADADRRTPPGPARLDLDGIRAVLELSTDRLDRAETLARSVLENRESSPPARAWAGFVATAHRSLTGRGPAVESVATQAVSAAALSPETASLPATVGFLQTLALGLEGRLEPARDLASRVRAGPGEHAAMLAALYEGRIAFHAGQVRTSARRLAGVVPFFPGYGGGWRSWLELMVAQALAAAGDADAARAALDRAEVVAHPGMPLFDPERGLASAWVAAAEGDVGTAVVLAGRTAVRAAQSGQHAMEVLVRQTAVQFGDRGQAIPLEELASVVDGPRVALAARHARRLADRDATGLLTVSADLEEIGLDLVAADAAAQAADVLRTRGRTGDVAAAAGRAASLARRCEGARTPALRIAGTAVTLSAREREVALLAAGGLSNRQIAARLHISVRTVESHVYRTCTRLGLADRKALADVVASR